MPKLTAYHSNVLLRNQELSKDEYARILALWGDKTKHHAWYEDPDHHRIQYVTNRAMPELGGKRGIFLEENFLSGTVMAHLLLIQRIV